MSLEKIIIIDGYSFVFRAYHAMPALSRPKDGKPVGALYGFISMLIRVLLDMKPTHLVVVLDCGKKTHRHEIYPEYKANRPPPPEDLVPQFPLIREAITALNIKTIEQPGYEADDVIATLAHKALHNQEEVLIISSDKDLMSLVNGHTKMYDAIRSKEIGAEEVKAKYGVSPDKIRDFLALVGDTSDNIPGIPGVGPKTASELLNKFGDIEGIYSHIDDIKQSKRKQALIDNQELLSLSRTLVTLVSDLALDVNFADLKSQPVDSKILLEFLHEQGFKSLIARVKSEFGIKDAEELNANKTTFNTNNLKTIHDEKELEEIITKANYYGKVSFYFQPNFIKHEEVRSISDIASISITINEKYHYFIPIADENHKQDLLAENIYDGDKKNISFNQVITSLKDILYDDSILKIFYDYKSFLHLTKEILDINLISAVDDIMLMSYDLGSGQNNIKFFELIDFYLDENTEKLVGGGITKSRSRYNKFKEREKSVYVTKQSYLIYKVHQVLLDRLFEFQQQTFYQKIDRPLSKIVYMMERKGFKVKQDILLDLAKDLEKNLNKLSSEIFKIAGEEFNIASPQQLSDILFNKMGIVTTKKSKTGNYKTSSDILETLQLQGHTIADLLIEWRKLYKIKTTYTTSLVKHINLKSNRIHTNFYLAQTSTGRFSSTSPNLQNIPARGTLSNKIRSAFVAEKGYKILSADYSQIELRLLAAIGNIENLKTAFLKGNDIHSITASQIFKVNINDVTPILRNRAKAINFGIIYGISAYGLAKNLNITREQASDYIKQYFNEYPGIFEYMEKYKKFAHNHGYVETITGRRCYVNYIHSKDRALRSFAERAAINFPLQGSSSDIIRKSMVKVTTALQQANLDFSLLLQIHDELLFEVKESDTDKAKILIKKVMENIENISIPLIVEVKVGNNWN